MWTCRKCFDPKKEATTRPRKVIGLENFPCFLPSVTGEWRLIVGFICCRFLFFGREKKLGVL